PILGTPTSVTLTNATGLPVATGISGLGTGVATFLATPSSANLATAVTNETGSGLLVFGTSPSLTTPAIAGATLSGTISGGTFSGGTWNGAVIGSSYGGAGTVSGLLKANGSGVVSAAVAGTDYAAALTGTTGQIAYFSGSNTAVGTSSLFISTAGNVGVGTSSPAGKLTVWGTTLGLVRAGDASDGVQLGKETGFGVIDAIDAQGSSYNDLLIRTGIIAGTGLAIKTTGNVGIGTTSPSQALSVQGNGLFSGNLAVANFNATGTAVIGSLNGLIKGTTGTLSAATLGTDYINNSSIDTSAELATILSDETGTGALVFGTSPSLTTPAIAGATLSGT
ncbi:MAG: hypothetical protein AAB921_04260, partial [Patescibacteria group bacterium]